MMALLMFTIKPKSLKMRLLLLAIKRLMKSSGNQMCLGLAQTLTKSQYFLQKFVDIYKKLITM